MSRQRTGYAVTLAGKRNRPTRPAPGLNREMRHSLNAMIAGLLLLQRQMDQQPRMQLFSRDGLKAFENKQ